MVKKKVDSRIRDLIENGVKTRERSMFIIVGDRARLQLPNLHLLLNTAAENKINKRIMWAYKKELGFTTHGGKREKKIKKEIKMGKRDPNSADPFELFLTTQKIDYVYYKESERILGNTFGMCILQDFEALTPNTLARTIETVEGGGIIVLMLKSMSSLKQLYTMSMDVYARYRTEAHSEVIGRFNERFLLSLRNLDKNSLIIDDEMNVLPALGERNIKRLPPADDDKETPKQAELRQIKESLEGVQPAQALVSLSKTSDQAKAILQFIDSIAEKTLRNTVALTAGRGRGKSAALGVAIAAAVAHGYSNIFITSPSPENLKTLFEFIFIGMTALNYSEGHDYDIFKSTNPAFNNSVVRVNIFKSHRQTIQYIDPADAHVLGQAELVVIDEAAAIPLPLVKKLLGPYLVFMASTINGYEGTGRSLSLKLISQLRQQQSSDNGKESLSRRSLKEISLDEPIRYAPGDKIEKWLNGLLCLNATTSTRTKGFPPTSECSLYHVNRDSLFSYHQTSEYFLHKVWALFVASHYKNSPNDLQLLSDAPAHQLFVLLGPTQGDKIPEPLCVIQVVLEGEISKQSIAASLSAGKRGDGDLIPWAVSQQFQDTEFATLSGARVLRIATNPEYQSMGYGSRALQLLQDYYSGKIVNLSENGTRNEEMITRVTDKEISQASLSTEVLKPRDATKLPPLLMTLNERPPEKLDYIGVSFGLSKELFKFWNRAKFAPVYLRQTQNDLTGEHSCIMLSVLEGREFAWFGEYTGDFYKRFLHLLAFAFKDFTTTQALEIIECAKSVASMPKHGEFTKPALDALFTPFDLKRLDSYANNALDYHVIVDMLPTIAMLYFTNRLSVELSKLQAAILLGIGLQKKMVEQLATEHNVPVNQLIAMFGKTIKKIANYFGSIERKAIDAEMPEARDEQVNEMDGVETKINTGYVESEDTNETEEANNGKESELKQKQRELINSLDLDKYAIPGDWDDAAAQKAAKSGGKIALKSDKSRKRKENADDIVDKELAAVKKKHRKGRK